MTTRVQQNWGHHYSNDSLSRIHYLHQVLKTDFAKRKDISSELNDLFDQLKSENQNTAMQAERDIKYFLGKNIAFSTIVISSFPADAEKLQQIALDPSSTKHPFLQNRGFEACRQLIIQGHKIGHEIAQSLAIQKMNTSDKESQKEGLKYILLSLPKWKQNLSKETLLLAIASAKTICMTDLAPSSVAIDFFNEFIHCGQKDDIVQLETTVRDLCSSDDFLVFCRGINLCKKIIYKDSNLIEIPLQTARFACASNVAQKIGEGLDLFWYLLSANPVSGMKPLLEALEQTSQKKYSERDMLKKLDALANHNFAYTNLSFNAQQTILQREKQDAPALLRILNNLSTENPSYFNNEIKRLKQLVERRIVI